MREALASELVPRLMLLHQVRNRKSPCGNEGDTAKVLPADFDGFLKRVLADDVQGCDACIEALLARGVAPNDILLDLMAEAARAMGELWESDERDLTEVTLGMFRLHQILRERRWGEGARRLSGSSAPKILLSTVGADQHFFGLVIVAEVFRQAGWRVQTEPGATVEDLFNVVSTETVEVVGLSASHEGALETARTEIAGLRAASLNNDVKVLVGGRGFPTLAHAEEVGADGWSADATSALDVASSLLPKETTAAKTL